ncbi:hypothetical protein D3C71_1113810 [compost metagenome]
MPEQAETGDVGHRGHAIELAETATGLVQGAHPVPGQADVGMAQLALFLGRRKDADAQGLGEIEQATGGGGVVALHVALFHQAGDGQAKDRLGCVDGVSACQRDTRCVAHRTATADHFPGDFRRQHVHRPAQDRNRHQGIAAHGVDVADGIGGGNSAEIEGIVDDRHEKVGGRDHTAFFIDGIHRRVVTRGVADPEFRVEILCPAAGQDHFQHLGGNFATASGAVTVLGQANRLAHRVTSWSLGNQSYSKRAFFFVGDTLVDTGHCGLWQQDQPASDNPSEFS